MGIEKYLERLKAVEVRFYEYRQRQVLIVEQVRNQVVKTVISKGPISEPSPFFWERMGVNPGKIIKEPMESDWCRRNHYDAGGRLVMVEEYSTFLGCFEPSEIYLYGEQTAFLLFTAQGLTVLREFEDDLVLAFAGSNGYIVEEFFRVNGSVQEVRIMRSAVDWWEVHRFHYDGQKLALIERICENGHREVLYTTKKPDFSEIRWQIDTALRSITEQGGFACLGVEGFLDQPQPMLCLCVSKEKEPPELIADWGGEMIHVPVWEWMLSDAQMKTCVKLVAELLVVLAQEGPLAGKGIWFHQNQVCVSENFAGARNVLKKAGVQVR